MSASITVRFAQEQHLEQISRFRARRERELYNTFGSSSAVDQAVRTFCSVRHLRSLMNDSAGGLLCALDSFGQPVGTAAFAVKDGHVELSSVYAAADGAGVGRALLTVLVELAVATNCMALQLKVFAGDQQAISFWKHMKFAPTGRARRSVAYPAQKLIELHRSLD